MNHQLNSWKIRSVITSLLLLFGMGISATAQNNPIANPDAVIVSGNARFTVLTPEMIRIEYSDNGAFEDRATFAIVNRNLDIPSFEKSEDNEYLYINTDKVALKYRKGSAPVTLPASSKISLSHSTTMDARFCGIPANRTLLILKGRVAHLTAVTATTSVQNLKMV